MFKFGAYARLLSSEHELNPPVIDVQYSKFSTVTKLEHELNVLTNSKGTCGKTTLVKFWQFENADRREATLLTLIVVIEV